ncbi:MAG: cytidine deaminase [Haloarculaceae archaeon]
MDELLATARDAREAAYAPYSEFPVGAAVETTDGSVYAGCNVEIANYSNSLHAEEIAVGKAVSDGHTAVERVAVSGGTSPGLRPCGACRQTLAEFAADDAVVLSDAGPDEPPLTDRLGDLLPEAIGPSDLGVDPDGE